MKDLRLLPCAIAMTDNFRNVSTGKSIFFLFNTVSILATLFPANIYIINIQKPIPTDEKHKKEEITSTVTSSFSIER